MMNLVAKRGWFFGLSLLLMVIGMASLAIPPRLRWGIDFSSGSTMSIAFEQDVNETDLRNALAALNHPEAIIQSTGQQSFFVRTSVLKEEKDSFGNVTSSEETQVKKSLQERFGNFSSYEFFSVAPVVARETVRNAAIAVVVASVAILLYVWWAFRRVSNPFRVGVVTVIALIHDVVIAVGAFSIFSMFMNLEITPMFITGLLTVIGYSVHDSIVVLDRIRENVLKGQARDLETMVNGSLLETLSRSLNTSLTTIFVLVALLLLGGSTIRDFVLVILVGIIVGTYSSICIAAQLLVVWERGDIGSFFRRMRGRPQPAKA